jgi:hypothetical protein
VCLCVRTCLSSSLYCLSAPAAAASSSRKQATSTTQRLHQTKNPLLYNRKSKEQQQLPQHITLLPYTRPRRQTSETMGSHWQPPATPPPEDLNSIPIQQLPLDPSSTTTRASESDHTISADSTVEHLAKKIASSQTWSSHPTQQQPEGSPAPTGTKMNPTTPTIKTRTTTDQNHQQPSYATAVPASPRSPGTAPTYPRALGPDTSVLDHNRVGANSTRQQHQQQQQQRTRGSSSSAGGHPTDNYPTGTPRVIVRIDRDHNIGDEATRFECEQFPEEMLGRVSRQTGCMYLLSHPHLLHFWLGC